MQRKFIFLAALAVLAGALATPVLAAEEFLGIDRDFANLTERVPGFGGLWFDEAGRLNVYLKDPGQAGYFLAMDPEARIRRGRYDFAELAGWRKAARPAVLDRSGFVYLDIDETENRIRIGVELAASRADVRSIRRALREAGVPRRAVVIERTEPILQMATLRDLVRPVVGGLQIRWSGFLCTLGFNASVGGTAGFVTNSHCTDQQGGVSRRRPTLYYQPLNQVPAEFIGTETIDPKYFKRKSGCPRGAACRFSDSAFAEYDSAGLSGGDVIAATTSCSQGGSGLTIGGSHTITGTASGNASVGTTVTKVGRTTGCSTGQVSGSCVDTGVSGSNIVLLCQDFVDAAVGGGDSGSPVFEGSGNVTLRGILWGGNGAGTLFVYSPYDAVKSELGLD